MLKDIAYAGIGTAVIMKEKVEEELKKLEDEGKIKTKNSKSFFSLNKEKSKTVKQ